MPTLNRDLDGKRLILAMKRIAALVMTDPGRLASVAPVVEMALQSLESNSPNAATEVEHYLGELKPIAARWEATADSNGYREPNWVSELKQIISNSEAIVTAMKTSSSGSTSHALGSSQSNTSGATPDLRKVFIIHGRNMKARSEMGIFVRSLGLTPINFSDLRASMGGTPTIADIVERGMEQAQGVIALFTPDEYSAVRPEFRYDHDQPDDVARWQARPNVIFEAGMAFGNDRTRVVFVILGGAKLFTDIAGIHVLRPTNNPSGDRSILRSTLARGMGCLVDNDSTDWMTTGDFEVPVASLSGVSPRDPF